MKQALAALASGWNRSPVMLTPLGDGHINDTLLATLAEGDQLVLQRINPAVFADPGVVMANLMRVQQHLHSRAPELTPVLHPTLAGDPGWIDPEGDWWRLWDYVPDGRSLSATEDPALCRTAGEAFGRLQRLLSDLPGPALQPTIPGFLELSGYLDQFDGVCAHNPAARRAVIDAAGSQGFIDQHRALVERFPRGHQLIHGDCKLNNLLFAAVPAPGPITATATATAPVGVRAILDLDTIMVGHWAWDFGDLVRSVLSRMSDDERAPGLFRALTEGFIRGSRRQDLEPQDLADAPVYIAFMLGIRFLTDHLEGDLYFKVDAPGGNLRRARAQFELVRRLPGLSLSAVAAEVLASVQLPVKLPVKKGEAS